MKNQNLKKKTFFQDFKLKPHKMNIEEAIDDIEALYPTDSPFPDTNEIGKELLNQAIEEVYSDWRNLPEEVILRYAQLCRRRG